MTGLIFTRVESMNRRRAIRGEVLAFRIQHAGNAPIFETCDSFAIGSEKKSWPTACRTVRPRRWCRRPTVTLIAFLKQNVESGSTVYTDGLKSFTGLEEAGFKHVPRSQPLRIELRKGAKSVVPLA